MMHILAWLQVPTQYLLHDKAMFKNLPAAFFTNDYVAVVVLVSATQNLSNRAKVATLLQSQIMHLAIAFGAMRKIAPLIRTAILIPTIAVVFNRDLSRTVQINPTVVHRAVTVGSCGLVAIIGFADWIASLAFLPPANGAAVIAQFTGPPPTFLLGWENCTAFSTHRYIVSDLMP